MLRPGELGALRRADVELLDLEGPGDPVVVLSFKSPKIFGLWDALKLQWLETS